MLSVSFYFVVRIWKNTTFVSVRYHIGEGVINSEVTPVFFLLLFEPYSY